MCIINSARLSTFFKSFVKLIEGSQLKPGVIPSYRPRLDLRLIATGMHIQKSSFYIIYILFRNIIYIFHGIPGKISCELYDNTLLLNNDIKKPG